MKPTCYLTRFLPIFLLAWLLLFNTRQLHAQFEAADITNTHKNLRKEKHKTHKDSLYKSVQKDKGIIPIPIILTDPNIGYGAIISLAYLHGAKSTRKNTPPTISAIGGGATSTRSWTAFIAHSQSFKNDKIRYEGGLLYAELNLDFYKIGPIDLSDTPVGVNLKGWGTAQRASFRIKNTALFIGPQYLFLSVDDRLNVDFENFPLLDSVLNEIKDNTRLSQLGFVINYDQRDNTISPVKGIYTGLDYFYNGKFLGATDNFWKWNPFLLAYVPIGKRVFSSYRLDLEFSGGDIPYFAVPYLSMRGVPALRYQGNNTMLAVTQWRGEIYKNISLFGFVGTGKALDDLSDFGKAQWVYNYGTGFRYTLQKLFGVRVGADFAWSNEDFVWYLTIGTAWVK